MRENRYRRRQLIELVHEFETHLQDVIETIYVNPYSTAKYELPDEKRSDPAFMALWEEGCAAGSAAAQLRVILARIDQGGD